ncbi:Nucleoside triphosphatase nudI [Serratia marcescens]|nr:Nucleoside triphosphatase nudI [Serratia marcescens]CUY20838.1 Nucleoside triphosphatase nudI [Serratia marcescens]CUY53705.1 Nucleoside triphosphatase nudI [Serratia marcescens]CUY65618.1 Nucleoside triphosphatase nudI [Serratia marcescens]CUZ00787.1 Nucleoside triphosphatase nudI [Serratia marcescens]
MRQRIIVCPLIENDNAFLLCKMAAHKGVFPGQWALSGGGVEPGEQIEQAPRRDDQRRVRRLRLGAARASRGLRFERGHPLHAATKGIVVTV